MRRTSERALVVGGLAACAGAALLLIDRPRCRWCWRASAALGLCIVWINVGIITLIQLPHPGCLLGRVDAALSFAIVVPQAASIAAGRGADRGGRITASCWLAMAAVIAVSAGVPGRRA